MKEFLEEENSEDAQAVQQLLNDVKRSDLEERYGMVFSKVGHPQIPPEVEGDLLDHISEFHRQLESAEQITLREFVGFPSVRPVSEIPETELEAALEELLDQFEEHEVFVDFPDHVDTPTAYQFIVDELLDEEIMEIRIPGMRLHFVYDEFRP